MEYNTNINNIITERLNNITYDDSILVRQETLMDESFKKTSSPKLIVALNTLKYNEDKGYCETFLNGWPITFIEASIFFREVKNNAPHHLIGDSKNFYDLVKYFNNRYIGSFFSQHYLSDTVQFTQLSHISETSKYLYPIRLLGRIQFETTIGMTKGVFLPEKVVMDAKRGFCKILLHDVYEGFGRNLTEVHSLFEKIHLYYNIPFEAMGFMDSNYHTVQLQKHYNTKGFFFPYWEFHLVKSYLLNSDKTVESKIEQRLLSQYKGELNCDYLFINLNRRIRPHRTYITLNNFIKHSEKILWSYTEPTSQNMQKFWGYLDDDKKLEITDYINLLPKIIDTDKNINDIDINELQFSSYINLVSETWFFEIDTLFVSEKVFKPILLGQPFIVAGNAGILQLLKSLGYETFSPYINEEYDNIINPSERLRAIFTEIDRLCNLTDKEIKTIMTALHGVCVRNRRKIISRVTENTSLEKTLSEIKEWVENKGEINGV